MITIVRWLGWAAAAVDGGRSFVRSVALAPDGCSSCCSFDVVEEEVRRVVGLEDRKENNENDGVCHRGSNYERGW